MCDFLGDNVDDVSFWASVSTPGCPDSSSASRRALVAVVVPGVVPVLSCLNFVEVAVPVSHMSVGPSLT